MFRWCDLLWHSRFTPTLALSCLNVNSNESLPFCLLFSQWNIGRPLMSNLPAAMKCGLYFAFRVSTGWDSQFLNCCLLLVKLFCSLLLFWTLNNILQQNFMEKYSNIKVNYLNDDIVRVSMHTCGLLSVSVTCKKRIGSPANWDSFSLAFVHSFCMDNWGTVVKIYSYVSCFKYILLEWMLTFELILDICWLSLPSW